MVQLFYTNYISVYLAHHELFCAKVGNGGVKVFIGVTGNINFKMVIFEDHFCFRLSQTIALIIILIIYKPGTKNDANQL